MNTIQKLFAVAIAATMMTGAFAGSFTATHSNGTVMTITQATTSGGTAYWVDENGYQFTTNVAEMILGLGSYEQWEIDSYAAAYTLNSVLDIAGVADLVAEATTPETPTYMENVTVAEAQTMSYVNDAAKLANQKAQIAQQILDIEGSQNTYFMEDVDPADLQMIKDAFAAISGEIEVTKVNLKLDRDNLVNAELRRRHLAGEDLKQDGEIAQERYEFDYDDSNTGYDFTDFTQNVNLKAIGTEIDLAAKFKMVRYGEQQDAKANYKKALELFNNGTYTSVELNAIWDKSVAAGDRYSRAWREHRDAVKDLENATKLQGYIDVADFNAGLINASITLRAAIQIAGRTDIDELVSNSHWITETGADTAWSNGVTGAGEIITIFDHFEDDNADTHGRRVAQIAGGIDEDFGTIGIAAEARIVEYTTPIIGPEAVVKAAADTNASVVNISVGGFHGFDSTSVIADASAATSLFVIAAGNDQHMDCRSSDNYAECLSIGSQFILGADSADLADKTILVGYVKTFSNTGGGSYTFNLGTRAGDLKDHYIVADGTAAAGKVGSSFAAPRVTGTAALVMQKFPTLSAAQVKDLILGSATDIGAAGTDDVFGRGKLNLLKALSIAE